MAISFKCGGCAKDYIVKDELAGKRAQCKKCGQVMTIPSLAAAHEPDLRADTRDPHAPANAETVAGSLIASPLETVAGRGGSVSGKSLSGRSMSGRSASGMSASGMSASGMSASGTRPASQTPPARSPADEIEFNNNFRPAPPFGEPSDPDDPGVPDLSALPHVAAANGDAFDVHGGTDQILREGRGPAAKNRPPIEPWSFLLVVAMLGVLGYAVYVTVSSPETPRPYPADVLTDAGKPWGVALGRYGVYAAMALALIGPLVAGAWVAALKIMNVRLPDGLYMRSLGIGSIAVALTALCDVGPLSKIDSIGMAAGFLAVGACYAILHFVQAQKPTVAGITTGIAAVLGAVGITVMQNVAEAVAAPMQKTYETQLAKVNDTHEKKQAAAVEAAKAAAIVAATPKVDTAAIDKAVKDTQVKLDAFKTGLANKRQTREAMAQQADAVASAIDAGKKQYPDRTEWAAMTTDLQAARPQVDAFPSGAAPAELTQAAPPGPDWSMRGGRKEVSAFEYDLVPPLEGVLDLDSRDTPGGKMVWLIGDARTKLTIEEFVATDAKQQRPWVAPGFVIEGSKNGAFAIAAEGDAPIEYGTINGLVAAKVMVNDASSTPPQPAVVYAMHNGPTWLKCTIAGSNETGQTSAQQAVRSLRQRAAGEPVLDPLPAGDLIARFQADPSQGDRLLGLIKGKPNAEDAVLKAIGFAPDDPTLERFGPLLVATASEKSSHTLWKLAAFSSPVAEQARDKLRALEPKTADDIAFAIIDLKSTNYTQLNKGLSTLAFADVDKSRLPQISKTLGAGIDDLSLVRGGNDKVLEAVLEKWTDPTLAKKVLALLDADKAMQPGRKLAMRVLGATGDKKYVQPIFNCVKTDPEAVTDTLIGMGAAAEPDIDRMLNFTETMASPVALKSALAILNEIGTQRSLSALQTLSIKSGDPEAKETAKAIIAKIKDAAKTTPPAK